MILPRHVIAWKASVPDAFADFEERAALVADGCKLPQRSEAAERLAEKHVRNDWLRKGDR